MEIFSYIHSARIHLDRAEEILREKGAPIPGTANGEVIEAVRFLSAAIERLAWQVTPHEVEDPTQTNRIP